MAKNWWHKKAAERLPVRFSKYVAKKGRCLVWTGGRDKNGYGKFKVMYSDKRATHAAFFLRYDRWPKKNILHSCDNPPCVYWRHLREGTPKENTADCIRRGRFAPKQNLARRSSLHVSAGIRKGAAGLFLRTGKA